MAFTERLLANTVRTVRTGPATALVSHWLSPGSPRSTEAVCFQ